MAEKKVGIIGAGVSGLAAVKVALEYGLKPTCFEQKDDIGGIWDAVYPYPDYLERAIDSRVYKGLTLNTSKTYYAYSDFPPLKEHPYYMQAHHVNEYLCAYADKFNLRPHIQCGRQVQWVEKAEDYETTGKWTVTTVDSKTKENQLEDTFDAIFVCVGYFSKARIPSPFPDQEKFKGTIIHAGKFWDAEPYKEQTVMVVGGSVSACDIATVLAREGAKKVYILARQGMWVLPRTYYGRSTLDLFLNRGFRTHASLKEFQDKVLEFCRARFDYEALGMAPDTSMIPFSNAGISDDIDTCIYTGLIQCIKGALDSYTEDGVKLSNGTKIQVDHLIYATGYEHDIPFLSEKQLIPKERPETKWWMHIYPVEQKHPTLFLIGILYIAGNGYPSYVELQARAACGVLTKELALPDKANMQKFVEEYLAFRSKLYGAHPSDLVDAYNYMVQLAEFVGCWPSMDHLEEISSDLATKAWNGPVYPPHLRLVGRHAKQDLAIKSLMEIEENAFAAHRNLSF